jgi:hypothetical protein
MFNDDGKTYSISIIEELPYFLFFLIKKKNVWGILKSHGNGGTFPPLPRNFVLFNLFFKKIKRTYKGAQSS